jgi:hypothetical protein
MALIESIFEQERSEHRVFALCLDDETAKAVATVRMPQIVVVRPAELGLEDFDLAMLLRATLEARPEVETLVYLAPERYLFGPTERLAAGDAAIQLWRAAADRPIEAGVVVLRRSRGAERALLSWCELSRQGRESEIETIVGIRVGVDATRVLGPADFARDFTVTAGAPHVGGEPLLSADFGELGVVTPELMVPQLDPEKRVSRSALVACFAPFADALSRAIAWERAVFAGQVGGLMSPGQLGVEHSLLACRGLRDNIGGRNLPHRRIDIGGVWDAYCSDQACGDAAVPRERVHKLPPCPDSVIAAGSRSEKVPRVSALVSTYAADHVIRGCLDDLVGQTLFEKGELEIIVIDSASPGDESAIVREYIARHPNIVLSRSDRREGVYMAWNRAATLARGAYLTNANTDDRHRHDGLERLADMLDAHPEVGVVYADSLITRQPNATFAHAPLIGRLAWPSYDLRTLVHCPFVGPHPMWRRRLHDEIGWFDARYVVAADYDLWCRYAEEHPLRHVDDVLGLYLYRDDSVEHANFDACRSETSSLRVFYATRQGWELTPDRYPPSYVGAMMDRDAEAQRAEREALAARERRATAAPTAQAVAAKSEPTAPSYACSILIAVPDSRELVERSLGAIVSATPRYIDYQVVLLLREASPSVRRFVGDLGGDVVVIESDPALDLLTGYRLAAGSCASDVVVLVDAAATVTEGWLDPLLRTLELEQRAGAVQGRRVLMGASPTDPRERIGAMAVRREHLLAFAQLNGSAPRATNYPEAAHCVHRMVEKSGALVVAQPRSSVVASAARLSALAPASAA